MLKLGKILFPLVFFLATAFSLGPSKENLEKVLLKLYYEAGKDTVSYLSYSSSIGLDIIYDLKKKPSGKLTRLYIENRWKDEKQGIYKSLFLIDSLESIEDMSINLAIYCYGKNSSLYHQENVYNIPANKGNFIELSTIYDYDIKMFNAFNSKDTSKVKILSDSLHNFLIENITISNLEGEEKLK